MAILCCNGTLVRSGIQILPAAAMMMYYCSMFADVQNPASKTADLLLSCTCKQTLAVCIRQVMLVLRCPHLRGISEQHLRHQSASSSSTASAFVQALHLQMYAVGCMAKLRKAVDSYYLVGVNGLQSGGKSTLTENLTSLKVRCHAPALTQLSYSLTVLVLVACSAKQCCCFP